MRRLLFASLLLIWMGLGGCSSPQNAPVSTPSPVPVNDGRPAASLPTQVPVNLPLLATPTPLPPDVPATLSPPTPEPIKAEPVFPASSQWPQFVSASHSSDDLRALQTQIGNELSMCDDINTTYKTRFDAIDSLWDLDMSATNARSNLQTLSSCIDTRIALLQTGSGNEEVLNARLSLIHIPDLQSLEDRWQNWQKQQQAAPH